MNTLKKDKEFQIIYSYGKKTFGYFSLIFFNGNKNNDIKCGFVVSKKVGNAVCRNRIRRLFREFVKNNIDHLKIGYDIIFVSKKNAGEKIKELKYKDIEKDLLKILRNSDLLQKK